MASEDEQDDQPQWGQPIPPRSTPYWTQLAEQRLNTLDRQVRDIKAEVHQLRDKQGSNEQSSRENGWAIRRVEEMLSGIERTTREIRDTIPDKRRAELVEKVVFGLVGLILIAVVGLWLKTIGIGR